jgi:hypothetical protein
MILCAVLSAAVWYFARGLNLYISEDSVDYDDLELKEWRGNLDPKITSREATPAVRHREFVPVASQGGGNVMVMRNNDVLDMSDHLEDSMEEVSRGRRPSGLVY